MPETQQKALSWGRQGTAGWKDVIGSLLPLALCPFMPILFELALDQYQGNIWKAAMAFLKNPVQLFNLFSGKPFWKAGQLYVFWYVLNVALYLFFPGKYCKGQLTPAGHLLEYYVNGFQVWVLTILAFFGCAYIGLFPLTIIADYWAPMLLWLNVFGYTLTGFAYVKAHLFPTHPDDNKFSGSFLYDLCMGIEFNPRIGKWFDFKLFHNGRPGINAWCLINISFAAKQYQTYGFVTNSMIIVNLLQALYVGDFFYNESWYTRTIDICHDHFGYYLAWGDLVWLPQMYTLQAHYLATHPVVLSTPAVVLLLGMGCLGYYIFRGANHQKDAFRAAKGKCNIWGRPAKFLEAPFTTADGQHHVSQLLYSGFWGLAHHFNYVGDLLMSSAYCLAAGLTGLADGLPYFYIVYMTALLVHRIIRDQGRLSAKYGPVWDKYCKLVPWKLCPYLW
ncbi:putative 7-dehydrocholesterol reductase [Paratrimastix pyriformis]|uniref:7-dehydrocholesterol reductase n=1 Tax=Paratrimastix pyriformis TaxID=342808 RepID=A0ABQ8UTK4_9EUKA|nr:putative 7-dehydrocholesterol reductase [Paratrimastix pyriformis]